MLSSGSTEGPIKVWNTETWPCEHTVAAEGVTSLALCGDQVLAGVSCGHGEGIKHFVKAWSHELVALIHMHNDLQHLNQLVQSIEEEEHS